jgi:tripartite-type tricarboxylate transporter receptor subunit TctC
LPPELASRLNAEVEKILREAEVRTRFTAEGAEPVGGSPAEFAAFFAADHEKWRKVVKGAGIAPD